MRRRTRFQGGMDVPRCRNFCLLIGHITFCTFHFYVSVMAAPPTSVRETGSHGLAVEVTYPVRALLCLLLGMAVMYVPTFMRLAETVWATDEQGHGPLILAACAWLLWDMRAGIFGAQARPAPVAGFLLLLVAVLTYVVGRSQQVIEVEGFSQIPVLIGCLLLLRGCAFCGYR